MDLQCFWQVYKKSHLVAVYIAKNQQKELVFLLNILHITATAFVLLVLKVFPLILNMNVIF